MNIIQMMMKVCLIERCAIGLYLFIFLVRLESIAFVFLHLASCILLYNCTMHVNLREALLFTD